MAFNLFEHLFNFNQVLNEVWQVLPPCRYLYIAVLFLARIHADPAYYFRYTSHSWKRALYRAAFREIQIEPCGGGAVTAALNQVDFLIPNLLRGLALQISPTLDRRVTKRSGGLHRNANDYPIRYFAIRRK
nr:hypothetical protein [Desulfobacterales bacterium]